MTEHDYLLVTALQRLRIAREATVAANPHHIENEMETHWDKAIDCLDTMIERLETLIQARRDQTEARKRRH
jgi:hypothetical protein